MEKKIIGKDFLEAFIKIAPFIKELYPDDIAYAVTDKEKFLAYIPNDAFDSGMRPGMNFQISLKMTRAKEIKDSISYLVANAQAMRF